MLSLVRKEMREFNLKDSAFSVSTANYEPIVLTLPAKIYRRVFQFPGKLCAYTTGTGNTYPHESAPCSKDEAVLFFLRLHALLADDRVAFVKGKGAEFAGEVWNEVHKDNDHFPRR